ncbi:type IV toxin-antitoxin system AbiEi family antitoxin domain-containing protein [Actinomycetaceae bacterium L2_0104]
MKSREALKVLAEVSESQWGMITSAQANTRGVSHMNLTRLTKSGDLIRLSHGVYKDAGAPGSEYDELRSAWLASDPTRLAWDRLKEKPGNVIVSGESAAMLHGIGDLRGMRSEFTTPSRKQTQRADVHYRTRILTSDDVVVREGLPVTTLERTIADLVEQRTQLDHVGNALRDAARSSRLDTDRLAELLGPLAERNGHLKGDGNALLDELLESAHIDLESLSKQIVRIPELSALVAREYLTRLDTSELIDSPAVRSVLEAQTKQYAKIAESLSEVVMPVLPVLDKLTASMSAATAVFDSPKMRSILEAQKKQLATISKALSELVVPQKTVPEGIRKASSNPSSAGAALSVDNTRRLSEAINVVDWASLTQHVKQIKAADLDKDES